MRKLLSLLLVFSFAELTPLMALCSQWVNYLEYPVGSTVTYNNYGWRAIRDVYQNTPPPNDWFWEAYSCVQSPTNINISSQSINENAAANTVVGTLSAVGGTSPYTYSLVSSGTYPDNNSFNISGASLRANAAFNYEVKNSYSIRIQVTGSDGGIYQKNFTITVNNVNEAPTNILLSNNVIDENEPANTTIGSLSTQDPEGGAMTYVLDDNTTYPDNQNFTITGNSITASVSFNYEIKNSYTINTKVTDNGGLTYSKNFTINIIDRCDYTNPVVSPSPTATLTGSSVLISWDAIEGAASYELNVGTAEGGTYYYNGSPSTNRSYNIKELPVNGEIIHVEIKTVSSACSPTPPPYRFTYTAVSGEYAEYPEVCGPLENMRLEGRASIYDLQNAKEGYIEVISKVGNDQQTAVEIKNEWKAIGEIGGEINLYKGTVTGTVQKAKITSQSIVVSDNVNQNPETVVDNPACIIEKDQIKLIKTYAGSGGTNTYQTIVNDLGVTTRDVNATSINCQTLSTTNDITSTGAIVANQFKVGDWVLEETPDFVFAKDYNLRPLEDVKNYVEKNRHLPDVPSAETMVEEGIDLVRMNMILLRKVEELTLYGIRQQEQLRQQNEKIEILEKKVRFIER